uniref:Uncharacterized protein n=1 Tax=Tanacetum cinerariifolium TaxID=118510 RepID=A0A6L2K6T1_TANCI|nr:hypothetical protein [Tanacetum cinerariifolium]
MLPWLVSSQVVRIISSLHKELDMIDLGALNYFLGVFVTRESGGMFLPQKKYVLELLDRAHMTICDLIRTPVDTKSKLSSNGYPIHDPTLCRSLVALKRVLRYVCDPLDFGLQLYSFDARLLLPISMLIGMVALLLGGLHMVTVFSWGIISSKRQHTLSRSSMSIEGECIGVTNVVTETA